MYSAEPGLLTALSSCRSPDASLHQLVKPLTWLVKWSIEVLTRTDYFYMLSYSRCELKDPHCNELVIIEGIDVALKLHMSHLPWMLFWSVFAPQLLQVNTHTYSTHTQLEMSPRRLIYQYTANTWLSFIAQHGAQTPAQRWAGLGLMSWFHFLPAHHITASDPQWEHVLSQQEDGKRGWRTHWRAGKASKGCLCSLQQKACSFL